MPKPKPKSKAKKTTRKVVKKTTKKSTKTKSTTSASKMNLMKGSAVKFKGESRWMKQAQKQIELQKVRYSPKVLIFGEEGTGKTHNGCSAFLQSEFQGKRVFVNSFAPVRIIDCNRSANLIATKDFPKAYAEGKIVVINPYIQQIRNEDGTISEVAITDPIKKVVAIRQLINELKQVTDGSVFIDGIDQAVKDCMYYIYRQYNMTVREDGSIWKKKYDKMGTMEEERVGGIVQWQYGARNKPLLEILEDLSMLTIPVIMTAHSKEKYINQKPSGIVEANLIQSFNDDVDCIIRFVNFEKLIQKKIGGATTIQSKQMRKMIVKKNRFQKENAPDSRIIEQESFEFTDIFNIIAEGL